MVNYRRLASLRRETPRYKPSEAAKTDLQSNDNTDKVCNTSVDEPEVPAHPDSNVQVMLKIQAKFRKIFENVNIDPEESQAQNIPSEPPALGRVARADTNRIVDATKAKYVEALYSSEQLYAKTMAQHINFGYGTPGYAGLSQEQLNELGRSALREKIKSDTDQRAHLMGIIDTGPPDFGMRKLIMPYLSGFADKLPLNDYELAYLSLLLDMPIEELQQRLNAERAKTQNRRHLEAAIVSGGSPGARLLFTELHANRNRWRC